jgi:hypothetical protein
VTLRAELLEADLRHLDGLWQGPLGDAYQHYRRLSDPRLALAAALVEIGIGLHGLGSHVATPGDLLLGDLCLARSSRLLAEAAGRFLQVRIARAIEHAAALAASGTSDLPVRALLTTAIEEGS